MNMDFATTAQDKGKGRVTSLTLKQALKRLHDASEMLKFREEVKPHEEKRIKEALGLLELSAGRSCSKTAERNRKYQRCLLQEVSHCWNGRSRPTFSSLRRYSVREPLTCSTLSKLIEKILE